jgi:hypothetical protein
MTGIQSSIPVVSETAKRSGDSKPEGCQVCGKEHVKLQRCQRCRSAWYCSVACQRQGWKAGHRQQCQTTMLLANGAPEKAWKELSSLLASSTVQQAEQDYHVATDEVQRIQREVKEPRNKGRDTKEDTQTPDPIEETVPAALPLVPTPSPVASRAKQQKLDTTKSSTAPAFATNPVATATAAPASPTISDWRFHVEDMSNLSCFQVHLEPRRRDASMPFNAEWEISMQSIDSDRTVVSFRPSRHGSETVLRLEFPASLLPEPRVYPTDPVGSSAAVSIRLSYKGLSTSDSYTRTSKTISPDVANRLACRVCHQSLTRAVRSSVTTKAPTDTDTATATSTSDDKGGGESEGGSAVIQRVQMLPSSQWDDMTDYLMCYPGAAAINFGSASTAALQGAVWQDESLAVFHAQDVDGAVCVLAISGYGEDGREGESENDDSDVPETPSDPLLVRGGSRPWREAVGGATLTCSQCATVLGWAPIDLPDTFRFLQHRLTVSPSTAPGSTDEGASVQRSSSYVAREMIRYAETQAIFTFCVVNTADGDGPQQQQQHQQRFWLRLLTWDTQTADSIVDDGKCRLQWKSVAKILYEETNDAVTDGADDSKAAASVVWMWNNDLCCPPESSSVPQSTTSSSNASTGTASLIRLYLTDDEWQQLRADLLSGGQYYPKAVVQAMVMAQTGRMMDLNAGNVGLAAIPIT